jgi:Flp pilus assembly protein TadG
MLFEAYLPWLAHPQVRRARERLRALPWVRSEGGAVAVEFAIVAMPFIFIIFSVFELTLILLIYSTLENGMGDAARTIRTGSLQTGGGATATTFRNAICNNLGWLQADCQAKLQVDVRTMAQFTNPSQPDPYSTGTFDSTKTQFTPGAQGSIVLVRAWYPWPLILPSMNNALSRSGNGIALIQATTTFKNESY